MYLLYGSVISLNIVTPLPLTEGHKLLAVLFCGITNISALVQMGLLVDSK